MNEGVQGGIAETLTIRLPAECTSGVLLQQSTPTLRRYNSLLFNIKQGFKFKKVYLCTFFDKLFFYN